MPKELRHTFPNYTNFTDQQSPNLKRVNLLVSGEDKGFRKKMFGTKLRQDEKGLYQDPCAGDSGGPLMYQIPGSGRWVIIG